MPNRRSPSVNLRRPSDEIKILSTDRGEHGREHSSILDEPQAAVSADGQLMAARALNGTR